MEDSKWSEDDVLADMQALWRKLLKCKGTERTELARRYAVTMTELEKVMGYYNTFVIQDTRLEGDSE